MRSIDDLPERALVPEVAQVLRASPRFVSNECLVGRLRAFKVAGRYQITREAVRAYLAEREAEAEAARRRRTEEAPRYPDAPPANALSFTPPGESGTSAGAPTAAAIACQRARANAERLRRPSRSGNTT